jgi:hypothetical protein
MWRIFRTLGLYSQAEYDDSAWTKSKEVPPLDDIKVAARARIGFIDLMGRTMSLLFCVTAVGWLGYIQDEFLEGQSPYNMDSHPYSNDKYREHFSALCEAGVLEDLSTDSEYHRRRRKEIQYVSSYFAVPKNDKQARSIFNGRFKKQTDV